MAKTILDYLEFDITKFFNQKFKEIGSNETIAVLCIDYELMLKKKEFAIFNYLRFRVMFDKFNVESEQHINIHYYSKDSIPSLEISNSFIKKIYSLLGNDNHSMIFKKNDYINPDFSTSWSVSNGESFIQIKRNENLQIEFHILFVNNILKECNKKILF